MKNREAYPSNWNKISLNVRNKAGWHCEWCGVSNGAIGYREPSGKFVQLADCKANIGMEVEEAAYEGKHIIVIVLTVAHLGTAHADGTPGNKHDKMDVRPENLASLCQRCHLNYDRIDTIARRKRKKHPTTQTMLTL